MAACQAGRTEIVRLLLKQGADVNAKNKDGETALDYAPDEDTRKLLKEASEKTAYTLSGEYARGNDISVSVANRAHRNGR